MSSNLYEALERAAKPTLQRIREDCERLPPQLDALVAYIEENLFDPQLTVKKARAAAGVRSHSLAAQFRAYTEVSIKVYIEIARMEVADRLLRLDRFEVGRVSTVVGYEHHATFLRAYKAWAGELPSTVGAKASVPEIDYPTWRRTWHGELAPEEARDFLTKYLRLYPDAGTVVPADVDVADVPAPRIDADGERYERFRAQEIWRRIRDLPVDAQRWWLRQCDFRTTALFDLLREISREEGRRDRRRGVAVARLALDSLEGREEVFGERIHDLRALGHACLANAYRLAGDFPAADAEFERAEGEWRVPRRGKDLRVQARILDLETSLRIFQRGYGEALRLAEHARDLYERSGDLRGEVRSLLQLAAIRNYRGEQEESLATLRAARELVDEERDPFLAFAVHGNLASRLARVGHYSAARRNLALCREHYKRIGGDPLGALRIQRIDAMIKQGTGERFSAEHLLIAARVGYAEARELKSFGVVSLELAILYAEQERWTEVSNLTAEAVPILQDRKLNEETLAAVRLLGQAFEAQEISAALLCEVRDIVLADPLAALSS